MLVGETQNERDARIEELWHKLDQQKKGKLDVNGLKKGLDKIDHPLKNANELLHDVIKAMDKDGDEAISYEEFRTFVEKTENELYSLFLSIDHDRNGKLDKTELRAAFKRAGLSVPNSKLDQFFSEVDGNQDGYISFDEWRNFLLFLPTHSQPSLKAVMSYYSSTITLNAEGDSSISDDTLEGLGTNQTFLSSLFGSIIKIYERPKRTLPVPPETLSASTEVSTDAFVANATTQAASRATLLEGAQGVREVVMIPTQPIDVTDVQEEGLCLEGVDSSENFSLTDVLPHPGYFAAGAMAGAVSRTCTAPLDRLKVYLIANIESAKSPAEAAKQGNALKAAKQFGRPLINATKDLWAAGGMRSLFAGNGLNVLKVMPESAIRFGSFEFAKRLLAQLEGHGDPKHINPYSKFLAGGLGGMASQLAVYPIDTLKFRMQCETVQGGLHGNALIKQTWMKMYKEGGMRASYRGLTMGLVGMFPYSAIDLGTFEFLKTAITRRNAKIMGCHEEDALPGSFTTGLIGACSGAIGASVVYPLNVLRTRLQAQGTVLHPPTYTGIVDVTVKTVKNEGFRGLFKGITPNLLKVVPSVSITYVVYENSKKALGLS